MGDEITDSTVEVPREILLRFLEVLGVNVGHDEFDANIDDSNLRPSFRPECVLVQLYSELVKIGGVLLDAWIDFVRFLQGAVCDGAFGRYGEGVVVKGEG